MSGQRSRRTGRPEPQLVEHSRVSSLLGAALDDGMQTLKMDGIEKVLGGFTDIKMVRSVCIR